MTNKEKLEAVKNFCRENNIDFTERKKPEGLCDVFLTKFYVAIHISNEKDAEFYERYKGKNPVFIREEESVEFIIEKVQNTIIKSLNNMQFFYMKRKKMEEKKNVSRNV